MKDSVETSCGRIVTSVKSRTDIRGILLPSDGKTHTKVKVNSSQHWDSSGAHPACVAAGLLAAPPAETTGGGLLQPVTASCSAGQIQVHVLPLLQTRLQSQGSVFTQFDCNISCRHRRRPLSG
ncbi:hypothetical protein fugu_016055 [Takifugu bimaculatus]|uniref:Uncharacterized protein n=1 Tax=Takifugu bimaculatus TaxID=433685 RepID=A0A4Z2BW26_9TELE|nr:hypothetical protein fugu_016055 [Takifugu bimaculatus]